MREILSLNIVQEIISLLVPGLRTNFWANYFFKSVREKANGAGPGICGIGGAVAVLLLGFSKAWPASS
jgi:hypothetical protein